MIIPMRCMSCGKILADKWRYFQEKRGKQNERVYFDGNNIPETPEKKIMDSLNFKRPCCRKHFITQIDLIDKL
jgi:DNA-directed RNA polymerase I, II, and III subunit RPABC5